MILDTCCAAHRVFKSTGQDNEAAQLKALRDGAGGRRGPFTWVEADQNAASWPVEPLVLTAGISEPLLAMTWAAAHENSTHRQLEPAPAA